MLFSSMTFIYLFLPIVFLAYFFVRKEAKNAVLLISSIIFYAWGGPSYLAIILLTILVNYVGAILLDKYESHKKLILILSILGNLSFLVYFKYFNFIFRNINNMTNWELPVLNIIMPIGISFYTFQAMSYLIDVYRGETRVQKDIYKLSLYVTLFPQLVAGPIVKYHDVANQIDERVINFNDVTIGFRRFIFGLAKKMLIANTCGALADKVFEINYSELDTLAAWLGSFAYSLQLYYDFSGYSDMAIGIGMIFGFRFFENFNYPYISKSVTEFWRRWHISLSTWFKEYLYIPLGGNRVKPIRVYFNLCVVFLATGVWHGAEWTFVIWGLLQGAFIIFEKITNLAKDSNRRVVNFFKHIYLLIVVLFSWTIFRAVNLTQLKGYYMTMLNLNDNKTPLYGLRFYLDNATILALLVGILCALPIFRNIATIKSENKILSLIVNLWVFFLLFLSTAKIASSTYNPFIYFRF